MLANSLNSLKIKTIWFTCLLITGVALSANMPPSSPVTPKSVERMLTAYGPRATVQRLTKNAGETDLGDYEKVLDGVSKGETRWLRLVPRLRPGTDAATGETLVIAVAEALPKNPTGVLRLIRADRKWLKACNYPMIEPTKAEQRIYFRKAIPAVRSVRDPALQSAKNRCLADLVKMQHTS